MSLPALAPVLEDACAYCGHVVAEVEAVPGRAGAVFHAGCAAAAEIERLMRRAANAINEVARADKAELIIRGVPLP